MNKFNVVMVCAGVFCTAALSSVKAAVYQKIGDDEAVIKAGIESELKKWIGKHIGDWAGQTRGNNTKDEPDFGKHLLSKHESKSSNGPTVTDNGDGTCTAKTQFAKKSDKNGIPLALKAVDAFLWEIKENNVTFSTDPIENGDGWKVKATLNKEYPLDYTVYDPVAGSKAPNSKVINPKTQTPFKNLENFTFNPHEDEMKNYVEGWKVGKLKYLNFNFYKDGNGNYVLSTIYPSVPLNYDNTKKYRYNYKTGTPCYYEAQLKKQ